jgi:hypothetical protein
MLGRANYDDVLVALEGDLATASDEADMLARGARRMALSLGSIRVDTVSAPAGTPSARPLVLTHAAALRAGPGLPAVDGAPLAAVATIPTVGPPYVTWRLGPLAGERRLLSDDIRLLEAAASLVGRRVDGLRVAGERLAAAVRDQQISRLATEAELRALRAQVNPHFLFNALATIAFLIRSSPGAAEATLFRLTSLLRGVLRRTRSEFTTLAEELELVAAYLEIERARFEERLRVAIDVPAPLRALRIPALLIQPLVENAVKHGIAPFAAGGAVTVRATTVASGRSARLRITVHDTGAGASRAAWARGRATGVGLTIVEQRLACHYGGDASFAVDSGDANGTTVVVELPLDDQAPRVSELAVMQG